MSLGVLEFLNLGSARDWTITVPMAILHAAFDESGKFNDHDVTSLCGWIATYDGWDRFGKQWSAALDAAGIPELHTAEFMGLFGQYSHLRTIWGEDAEKKRDEILTALVNVIRGTMGKGVGATIDSKHFRSMDTDFKKSLHKSGKPDYIAFTEVLEQTLWNVEVFAKEHGLGPNVMVSLIFDQEEGQSVEALGMLNKAKKEREQIRERVSGICFCNRRTYNPLQAADFIAYETKKEMERRNKTPDAPISKWFTLLSSTNRLHIPDGLFNARIFDVQVLDELEVEFKRRAKA